MLLPRRTHTRPKRAPRIPNRLRLRDYESAVLRKHNLANDLTGHGPRAFSKRATFGPLLLGRGGNTFRTEIQEIPAKVAFLKKHLLKWHFQTHAGGVAEENSRKLRTFSSRSPSGKRLQPAQKRVICP